MALGSQQSRAETLSDLAGLTHDIFVGDVEDAVRRHCVVSSIFEEAGPGDFYFSGDNMTFATDLDYKTGAMATDGNLPDHVGLDAVQGQVTPIRRYVRIALDNLVEQRASGEGAFEDLGRRIFRHMWNAWYNMEIRHSTGPSSGLVAKVSSRDSGTAVTLKDGYGRSGTPPLMHLSPGSIVAWYDVDQAQVGGAAAISSIDYDNDQITIDSNSTWEPSNNIAVDDTIFFATTSDSTTDYFTAERNLAPNGIGTILDPNADLTTVFNISETTNDRWKPFRKSSTTFDHLEVTEHWLQHGAKRGFDVSPATDRAVTFPSAAAQLSRSLMAFQQQAYTGGELRGGYNIGNASGNTEDSYEPHAGLTISGIPIYVDGFFYHDVFATLCPMYLYRVVLGGEEDFWAEDGSMWSRIQDFDGKEAFVGHYMNTFSNNRLAHGALTGISTDVTDADFVASVPNY